MLVSVTYIILLGQRIPFGSALVSFGWSLCTILGIAGFGYLSNDLGDRKADHKAGKKNLLATLPMTHIVGLVVLFLGLGILPWVVYFPLTKLTGVLLGLEFLLFVFYVLPPFRLKERRIWGVFTDALYAHAVPAALAGLTFLALADPLVLVFPMVLPTLVIWQFCLGMRNILLHQLKDAKNDRISRIQTFVTRVGESKSENLLAHVFVPLELLAWLLFLGAMTSVSWLPLVGWAIYLLWQVPKQGNHRELRTWLYAYLDDFYIPYLPMTILISLCLEDWRMTLLALLHVLLFKTALSPTKFRIFQWIRRAF